MGYPETPFWLSYFEREILPTEAAKLMFGMFGEVSCREGKAMPVALPQTTQKLLEKGLIKPSENGNPYYEARESLGGGYCWELYLKSSNRRTITSRNTLLSPAIHSSNVNGAQELITATYGNHRFLREDYPVKDIVFTSNEEGGGTGSFRAYGFCKDQFREVNFGRFRELCWVDVQDLLAIASVEIAPGTLIEMWKSMESLEYYALQAGFYSKISLMDVLRRLAKQG